MPQATEPRTTGRKGRPPAGQASRLACQAHRNSGKVNAGAGAAHGASPAGLPAQLVDGRRQGHKYSDAELDELRRTAPARYRRILSTRKASGKRQHACMHGLQVLLHPSIDGGQCLFMAGILARRHLQPCASSCCQAAPLHRPQVGMRFGQPPAWVQAVAAHRARKRQRAQVGAHQLA